MVFIQTPRAPFTPPKNERQILLEILDEIQRRSQHWAYDRMTISTTAGAPTEIHSPHAGTKKAVFVKSSPKNTDYVYIGATNAVTVSGATEGYPLEPNEVVKLADFSDCDGVLYAIAAIASQVLFRCEFLIPKAFTAKQAGALTR